MKIKGYKRLVQIKILNLDYYFFTTYRRKLLDILLEKNVMHPVKQAKF